MEIGSKKIYRISTSLFKNIQKKKKELIDKLKNDQLLSENGEMIK